MKKLDFIRPNLEIDNQFNDDPTYCKLRVSPLERGYGQTIGNSLRRVLISSLPGAAIVAVSINDVEHEFTTVPGVREDVTEIILNLKTVVFTINSEKDKVGEFEVDGRVYETIFDVENNTEEELVVTAGSINTNFSQVIPTSEENYMPEVTIVNPDQPLFTLAKGAKVTMKLRIRKGVGYVNADENKVFCKEGNSRIIGLIPIDSIFTPVKKCRYEVVKTRYEDNFNCDLLTIEVWTNGSMAPTDALSLAAQFLKEHFEVIVGLNEEIQEKAFMTQKEEKPSNKKLDQKIEDLDLSVRSYNCLKRANINTVGELTQKTEEEMMKVRNLGRKSLKEVIQKLNEIGLSLRNSDGYFDEDEDDEDEYDNTSEDVIEDDYEDEDEE